MATRGKSSRRLTGARRNPSELVLFGNPQRRKHKKNPSELLLFGNPENGQAETLYEAFHGRQPREIIDAYESTAARKEYVALGRLVALGVSPENFDPDTLPAEWDKNIHLRFDGSGNNVTLAANPKGSQIYLIGGDQDVLRILDRYFEVDTSKDFIDLGEIPFVVYLARKGHSNRHDEYVHQLGEEGGTPPIGMYDKLRRRIYFVGGSYHVPLTGGAYPSSPGIVN